MEQDLPSQADNPAQGVVNAAGKGEAPSSGGFASVIGGVASLALVVGLGIWGYKLAMRDVTGIPVVRALEGPMRIQPDDPGGEAAAHMGFSVNAVQQEGGAQAPAERLALAPRPVDLAPEDEPVEQAGTLQALAPTPPAPETVATDPQINLDGASEADILAMADALAEGVTPMEEDLTAIEDTSADTRAALDEAVAEAAAQIAAIPASVPGVSVSPRPGHRPQGFAAAVQSARSAATQAQNAPAPASDPAAQTPATPARYVPEVPAEQVPAGTRLVQLGAFDSDAVARDEWDKLADRFEDYLEGKTRVIEKATSGGKTFYRLRAMGFDDLAAARRFCAVLMAGKVACIPVVTR